MGYLLSIVLLAVVVAVPRVVRWMRRVPDGDTCQLCGGTGKQAGLGYAMSGKEWYTRMCNGCAGTGRRTRLADDRKADADDGPTGSEAA